MKLKTRYNPIKHGLYLLVLLALPLFSLANDNHALFEKGNGEYAKGQYNEAVVSYRQILNGNYQSAVVYFNLGNAYYKLDDIPSALLYYEKAHKLAPGDDDINVNIQLANLKTTDKIEATPEFFVTKWWHSFILFFSVNTLAVLSVLFILAGSLAFILYLFTNSVPLKKSSFYTGMAAIFLGLVFMFMANRQAYYFNTHRQAIVFSNSVTAKSSPDGSAKPLFVVHEGTKVDVVQQNGDWIEVELPNGNAGWMAAADVKDI